MPEVLRLMKLPPLNNPRPPPPPMARLEPTLAQPFVTDDPTPVRPSSARDPKLTGIGGWLIPVAIGQIFAPLMLIATLAQYYSSMDYSLLQRFPVAFLGEAALNVFLFGISVYAAALFFRHSRRFPTFFIIQMMASFLMLPVNALWVAVTLSLYTGQPTKDFFTGFDGKEIGQAIAILIIGGIWVAYILKSKRVANTFVR